MNSKRSKIAVRQLKALKKYLDKNGKGLRLAAEGWDKNWKILISTILSAQTKDETTIKVCESLFRKFNSAKKIGEARLGEIEKIIRPINYYKTKARHIKETARVISKGGIPRSVEELVKLPGVGRKVANVYLVSAFNADCIGVDTHVSRISRKMGWTKNTNPHKIEKDLEGLFPKRYWNSINWVLVGFGREFGRSRKNEDKVLEMFKGPRKSLG